MTKSSNTDEASKKLKELKEAISLCSKIEDQVSWAMDFTSFTSIHNGLEPLYEAIEEVKDQFIREIDYIEEQLEDFDLKLRCFESENKINL